MQRSWINTIGILSLGYGLFLAFWSVNAIVGHINRHPDEPLMPAVTWNYLSISLAASIALVAAGSFGLREKSSVQLVCSWLFVSGALLLVKTAAAGWLIYSYVTNPSGPMDGLILILIPLAILPGILWGIICLTSALQLGRGGIQTAPRQTEFYVAISVPPQLVAEVQSLIAREQCSEQ